MIRLTHQKLRGLHASKSRRLRNSFSSDPWVILGMPEKEWNAKVTKQSAAAQTMLLKLRGDLVDAGVDESILPTAAELSKHAKNLGVPLTAQPYAELFKESRLDTPDAETADSYLLRKGLFKAADETPAGKKVLNAASKALANMLKSWREPARAKREAAKAAMQSASQEEMRQQIAKLEAEASALLGGAGAAAPGGDDDDDDDDDDGGDDGGDEYEGLHELVSEVILGFKARKERAPKVLTDFVKVYNTGDTDAVRGLLQTKGDEITRLLNAAAGVEVPEPPKAPRAPRGGRASAPATPTRAETRAAVTAATAGEPVVVKGADGGDDIEVRLTPGRSAYARLAEVSQYRAPIRQTVKSSPGYKPPSAAVLAEAKGDVLIYVLLNNTAQVWAKGALTETFQPAGRGKGAWTIAAQYARTWVAAKKSRSTCRILAASEAEPGTYEVAVESLASRSSRSGEAAPTAAFIADQIRKETKSRANPRARHVYYRNPAMRELVAEVQKTFRRRNGGFGIGTLALAGAAGFVGGTYAEAEFGLSKYFTRGGKATVDVVRSGKLPPMPKFSTAAPKSAAFEPSDRLAKMLDDFYALENKKKRVPFAQAAKREAMEDRLDAMWSEIETLEAQEKAGFRSNPRKLRVPDHITKTPRAAGTAISAIGVKGRWPIGDLFHARLAAVYIKSPSHAAHRAKVLRALEAYYPQYDWREFLARPVETGVRRAVANPAADLPGRYEAFRRMAAPGSGASANERRVALMQMEKIRKQLGHAPAAPQPARRRRAPAAGQRRIANPSGRVTVVTRRPGDGGYPETYYFDTLADAAEYVQGHRKTTITRITRDNEDVYEEVMAMAFGRSNPKRRLPRHQASFAVGRFVTFTVPETGEKLSGKVTGGNARVGHRVQVTFTEPETGRQYARVYYVDARNLSGLRFDWHEQRWV